MKQNILAVLFIIYYSCSYAQDSRNFGYTKYKNLDTIVRFQEGTNEYSFLWTKKQGFFWDTISHKIDCHDVVLNILNDTKDTIFITKLGGGDGALIYNRVNYNTRYNARHPLYNAILPNEILKVSVRLYSIERRYKFQKNLYIRCQIDSKEEKFGISSWGHFVIGYPSKKKLTPNKEIDFEKQTNIVAIDSTIKDKLIKLIPNPTLNDANKLVQPIELKSDSLIPSATKNKTKNDSLKEPIISKISSERTYKGIKIPYTISQGKFKGENLHSGEIEYYNSKDDLIASKLIKNGEEQEGYIYKGQKVNQLDSLGRKSKLWIYPISAAAYSEFRSIKNVEKLYQGIVHIENYLEGAKVDTQYTYNKEGRLMSIIVWGAPSTLPHTIHYYPDGNISQVDSFATHPKYPFVPSESIYYSDTFSNCIVKRKTYVDQKVNFTYKYVNCQLYSKTSVKEKYVREPKQEITYEIIHHDETFVGEGKIIKAEWDEVISNDVGRMPFTQKPIPYTVEIGDFDSSNTYLINGQIDYYNADDSLIESKLVVNGLIE